MNTKVAHSVISGAAASLLLVGLAAPGASAETKLESAKDAQSTTTSNTHDLDGDGIPDTITYPSFGNGSSIVKPFVITVQSSKTGATSSLDVLKFSSDGPDGTYWFPWYQPFAMDVDGRPGVEMLFPLGRGANTSFYVIATMRSDKVALLEQPSKKYPAEKYLWFDDAHGLYGYSYYMRGVDARGRQVVTSIFSPDKRTGKISVEVKQYTYGTKGWQITSSRNFKYANVSERNAKFSNANYGKVISGL